MPLPWILIQHTAHLFPDPRFGMFRGRNCNSQHQLFLPVYAHGHTGMEGPVNECIDRRLAAKLARRLASLPDIAQTKPSTVHTLEAFEFQDLSCRRSPRGVYRIPFGP